MIFSSLVIVSSPRSDTRCLRSETTPLPLQPVRFGLSGYKSMRANQLRLWFASMAYVLICALRRLGLAHTQFAQATCDTIRLQLLKIGALVRISIRRIKVAMASAFPHQHEFALARALLSNAGR